MKHSFEVMMLLLNLSKEIKEKWNFPEYVVIRGVRMRSLGWERDSALWLETKPELKLAKIWLHLIHLSHTLPVVAPSFSDLVLQVGARKINSSERSIKKKKSVLNKRWNYSCSPCPSSSPCYCLRHAGGL